MYGYILYFFAQTFKNNTHEKINGLIDLDLNYSNANVCEDL